jgi:phosphoenolpyruvate synthase/pyruvate phosphate dikinase
MAAMRVIEETPRVAGWLLDLDDYHASNVEVVGAKASNLAKARVAGFSVLPGFLITTAASAL